jgi:NAD(P)-dependent dehydrogenase (short-subunit alcohol dehydrogenase family)
MPSVLITGTSRGIGLETALAFARAGYNVHATMRNPSASPKLFELASRENLPISVFALDVDSDHSVSSAFATIHKSYGPIDVLVNNAGVERVGSIEEMPLGDFRAAMETNYFGAIRCIQAVVPQMRARRSGYIINVTSVAGRLSNPPLTAYCASKWALEALSEGLAIEMKPFNVRVAVVEPGIIDTAMARRIETPTNHSHYPHTARFASVFGASLQNPVHPSLVARKILDLAANRSATLRHPVGPDAIPILEWRRSMSDEQWIDHHSADDSTFSASTSRDLGLKL